MINFARHPIYWTLLIAVAFFLTQCSGETCESSRKALQLRRDTIQSEIERGDTDRALQLTSGLAELMDKKDRLCNESEADGIRQKIDSTN